MSTAAPGSAGGARGGRRRGRPPGPPSSASDTRDAIFQAARESFAGKGYTATTIRGVALQAGVDPSLVHHYFGTKDDLFLTALQVPYDPREVLAGVLDGPLDTLAWRLLDTVLALWDDPGGQLSLVALARTALSAPTEANPVREGLLPLILGPLRARLPEPAARRGDLVASQMLGLLVTRYLLRLEPLASMPRAEVVSWVAPSVQHFLTGDSERLAPSSSGAHNSTHDE